MPDENFEILRDIAAGQQRQRTEKKLGEIQEHLAREAARVVARCPYCDGELTKIGIEICKHCRKELHWHNNIVHKEGELDKAKSQSEDLLRGRRQKQERLEAIRKRIDELQPAVNICLYFAGGSFAAGFLMIMIGIASHTAGVAGFGFILMLGVPWLGIIFAYANGAAELTRLREREKNY